MVAQIWQAVGSFGLQVLAAWMLGAAGLGLLSLCLSIIVLAAAVSSGMVGDSLVILNRHDRRVRGGLQFWALTLAASFLLASVIGLTATGLLSPTEATLMGVALVAFQFEELVRRVFMATMRFWRLVIIDSAAVLTALAIVGIWALNARVEIATFFVALLVGQIAGIVVGVLMLPAAERALVSLRGAAIKQVAGFGAWRGAQVSVPPLLLTSMRVIVTVAVGGAALGELELARIYAAPALLAVQGFGSYLLSAYVRDQQSPLVVLTKRAWRAALAMMAAAVLVGSVLAIFGPPLSTYLTGPSIAVDRLAVAGWVLYVVASASCQPFASLAASRGRPALVLRCRLIDAGFVVALLAVLLLALGVSASWTPFVLAAGLFLGGVLVRQFALKPLSKSESGQRPPSVEGSPRGTLFVSPPSPATR